MEESIVSFFEQWAEEFARPLKCLRANAQPSFKKTLESSGIARLGGEARRSSSGGSRRQKRHRLFKLGSDAPGGLLWSAGRRSRRRQRSKRTVSGDTLAGQPRRSRRLELLLSATPLRFGALSMNSPEALRLSLRIARINITFKEAELPTMIVALEPHAAKILSNT